MLWLDPNFLTTSFLVCYCTYDLWPPSCGPKIGSLVLYRLLWSRIDLVLFTHSWLRMWVPIHCCQFSFRLSTRWYFVFHSVTFACISPTITDLRKLCFSTSHRSFLSYSGLWFGERYPVVIFTSHTLLVKIWYMLWRSFLISKYFWVGFVFKGTSLQTRAFSCAGISEESFLIKCMRTVFLYLPKFPEGYFFRVFRQPFDILFPFLKSTVSNCSDSNSLSFVFFNSPHSCIELPLLFSSQLSIILVAFCCFCFPWLCPCGLKSAVGI